MIGFFGKEIMKFKEKTRILVLGLTTVIGSGQGMEIPKSSVREYPEIIKSFACTGIEQKQVRENGFNPLFSYSFGKITVGLDLNGRTKVTLNNNFDPVSSVGLFYRLDGEKKLEDYCNLEKRKYTENNNDDENKNNDRKEYKERKITGSDFKKILSGKKSISVGIKICGDVRGKPHFFGSGYFSGDEFLTIKEDNENQKGELIYKNEPVLRSDKSPVTNVDRFTEIIREEKLQSVYVTLTKPAETYPVARGRNIEHVMKIFTKKCLMMERPH